MRCGGARLRDWWLRSDEVARKGWGVKRTALAALFAGLTLAAPKTASASLPYAPAVKDYLHLDIEPGCTLCHESNIGGDGTATRPFGETVRSFRAIGNDVGSLLYALELMDGYDDVDGDADGVHDLDELREGYDPNNAMSHPDLPPPPPPDPDPGDGGDDGTDDSASSAGASSGSGGTTSLDPSGAGGTRSGRPPPTRSNTIPEMKSGCAVTPGNSPDDAGTPLLFLAGLVGLMRGGRRSRHASLPA